MISKRHAAIETPAGMKIGVSTTARKAWREYFSGVPAMLGNNEQVSYMIAAGYVAAKPVHRFILNSREVAEIRFSPTSKGPNVYYVAAIRKDRKHDILVFQPTFKEAPKEISDYRLTDEWLNGVLSGQIKKRE